MRGRINHSRGGSRMVKIKISQAKRPSVCLFVCLAGRLGSSRLEINSFRLGKRARTNPQTTSESLCADLVGAPPDTRTQSKWPKREPDRWKCIYYNYNVDIKLRASTWLLLVCRFIATGPAAAAAGAPPSRPAKCIRAGGASAPSGQLLLAGRRNWPIGSLQPNGSWPPELGPG